MDPRPALRPTTSSGAVAAPGPLTTRLLGMAETASWAVMLLGLGAASLVLVQSYLLGG
ncbi:MAG TPA: hypothetical protein VNM90_28875 [Haliangium sp.]|jgi:hypothetical protein|nr:hypothetical protein [Haliangium sp.]